MRGTDLLDKMELADLSYVEAAGNVKVKKANFKKYILIAACVAVIAAAVGAPAIAHRIGSEKNTPIKTTEDNRYIVKHGKNNTEDNRYIVKPGNIDAEYNQTRDEETARVYRWEEMDNVQRYKTLKYNGREYGTRLLATHDENRMQKLGEASVYGQDYYTEEIHSLVGNVYKIKGVDEKVAVCFKFNESDQYAYAYANYDYTPDNLDEFINALDLRNNLKTDIVCDKREKDTVAYEDITTNIIWNMLLSDASVKNEPEKDNSDKTIFTVSARVDIIGYHNHTIGLTEDGYLWTNILDTGKYFYIGEEKVNAFIKEVTENHQGYIYINDGLTDTYGDTATEE